MEPTGPETGEGNMARETGSDPTVFVFLNEIGIIDQLATNLMERHLPKGLTRAQFAVLNHFVQRSGAKTPFELARTFQVTKGAMTNTLKKLQAHGFISVRDDPDDGRRKLVTITATGRDTRNASLQMLTPLLGQFSDHFATAELEDTLPMLRDIRSYLGTNNARAGQSSLARKVPAQT